MIELESHSDGIILPIRVQPGARRNGVAGEHAGALKISVTQTAEKGKANAAAIEALCETLKLRPRQLELISGATSRQKRFLIRGLTPEELQQRLTAAVHFR
jgi:uncharacterized protein (TIGR00251 family)